MEPGTTTAGPAVVVPPALLEVMPSFRACAGKRKKSREIFMAVLHHSVLHIDSP
jgi:hypothetical protein